MISTFCRDENPAHFDVFLAILKVLYKNERLLMKNVITIVKIMLLNGATIATPTWKVVSYDQEDQSVTVLKNDTTEI